VYDAAEEEIGELKIQITKHIAQLLTSFALAQEHTKKGIK
jgi:hypothetical protein